MCWSRQSSSSSASAEKSRRSRVMGDNRRVVVYDVEKNDLSKLPLRELPANDFTRVQIPRFGRFDIYASNEDAIESESKSDREVLRQPLSVQVVNSISQDTKGMSFRARVNFGGLGPLSNVRRVFSSRSRILYIGAIPT